VLQVAQDILEQVVVLVILGLPNGIVWWCYYLVLHRRAEDSTVQGYYVVDANDYD